MSAIDGADDYLDLLEKEYAKVVNELIYTKLTLREAVTKLANGMYPEDLVEESLVSDLCTLARKGKIKELEETARAIPPTGWTMSEKVVLGMIVVLSIVIVALPTTAVWFCR